MARAIPLVEGHGPRTCSRRLLGACGPHAAATASQEEAGPPTGRRPSGAGGHRLRAPERHPLGTSWDSAARWTSPAPPLTPRPSGRQKGCAHPIFGRCVTRASSPFRQCVNASERGARGERYQLGMSSDATSSQTPGACFTRSASVSAVVGGSTARGESGRTLTCELSETGAWAGVGYAPSCPAFLLQKGPQSTRKRHNIIAQPGWVPARPSLWSGCTQALPCMGS